MDLTEQKVKELLNFARAHDLAEMAWAQNGLRISFRRNAVTKTKGKSVAAANGNGAHPPVEAVLETADEVIRSPMVGRFRRATTKDRPSLVLEGNRIKPGERLGVVECMKIPTDVINFSDGVIIKILVEDGQVVEYGQPLFVVKPE